MPEILSIGELLDLGNSANMSSYVPYSGLEYNASGAISGISGSAIAGGVESSVVSSIVSSMVSGKVDQSAFEQCCDEVHSALDEKMDKSASGSFQPSGEYIYASASGQFAPSGDYAFNSSLSSKLDASSSGLFQPSGDYYSASNPSGFITGVDLSEYQEKSAMTGYQPSGDYAYNSSLSSYVNYSAISGDGTSITSINGSAIGGGGDYWPKSADSYTAYTKSGFTIQSAGGTLAPSVNLGTTGVNAWSGGNGSTQRSRLSYSGLSSIYTSTRYSQNYTASSEISDDRLLLWHTDPTKRDGVTYVDSARLYITPTGISGYSASSTAATAASQWEVNKAKCDYWDAKLDALPSAVLVGASGIIIQQSGNKFVISLDPNYVRP